MSHEFLEQIKAAFMEFAEAVKKIFEWLAKNLAKLEPPKSKERYRFRVDRGKIPRRFNTVAYGRRHKPP